MFQSVLGCTEGCTNHGYLVDSVIDLVDSGVSVSSSCKRQVLGVQTALSGRNIKVSLEVTHTSCGVVECEVNGILCSSAGLEYHVIGVGQRSCCGIVRIGLRNLALRLNKSNSLVVCRCVGSLTNVYSSCNSTSIGCTICHLSTSNSSKLISRTCSVYIADLLVLVNNQLAIANLAYFSKSCVSRNCNAVNSHVSTISSILCKGLTNCDSIECIERVSDLLACYLCASGQCDCCRSYTRRTVSLIATGLADINIVTSCTRLCTYCIVLLLEVDGDSVACYDLAGINSDNSTVIGETTLCLVCCISSYITY